MDDNQRSNWSSFGADTMSSSPLHALGEQGQDDFLPFHGIDNDSLTHQYNMFQTATHHWAEADESPGVGTVPEEMNIDEGREEEEGMEVGAMDYDVWGLGTLAEEETSNKDNFQNPEPSLEYSDFLDLQFTDSEPVQGAEEVVDVGLQHNSLGTSEEDGPLNAMEEFEAVLQRFTSEEDGSLDAVEESQAALQRFTSEEDGSLDTALEMLEAAMQFISEEESSLESTSQSYQESPQVLSGQPHQESPQLLSAQSPLEVPPSSEEPEKTHKKKTFRFDTSLIPQSSLGEQAPELRDLGLNVVNQDDFEQGVQESVDRQIEEEEARQRNQVFSKEMEGIDGDIKDTEKELARLHKIKKDLASKNKGSRDALNVLKSIQSKQELKKKHLKRLQARKRALIAKWCAAERGEGEGPLVHRRETDRDRLIRLGEMTPFGTKMPSAHTASPSTQPSHLKLSTSRSSQSKPSTSRSSQSQPSTSRSSQSQPSTSRSSQSQPSTSRSAQPQPSTSQMTDFEKFLQKAEMISKQKPKVGRHGQHNTTGRKKKEKEEVVLLNDQIAAARLKMQHRQDQLLGKASHTPEQLAQARLERRRKCRRLESGSSRDRLASDEEEYEEEDGSDEEYLPSKEEWRSSRREETLGNKVSRKRKRRPGRPKAAQPQRSSSEEESPKPKEGLVKRDRSIRKEMDDADDDNYTKRLLALQRLKSIEDGVDDSSDEEPSEEFKVSKKLTKKLHPFQRTSVQWLWELHQGGAGGIVGDEMGLGKTVQVIAFLKSLRNCRYRDETGCKYSGLGPVLIVCPATVMSQWVMEFHTWAPSFRVCLLHSTGSYTTETDLMSKTMRSKGVVVTSYSSLVKHQQLLLRYNWHYLILDEGHKIRNPDAQCTIVCKSFRTPHRLIISGSPIQNHLKELWSLLDFVNPGLLGTLTTFQEEVAKPILQGGHSNCSKLQIETSYRCARMLRDTMNPYLLRRMKSDVKDVIHLPNKTEQILFCKLTEKQEEVYMEYLASRQCQAILKRQANAFAGLQKMRDICNHPDMCTGGPKDWDDTDVKPEEANFGYWGRSGKMIVINTLLPMWKSQNHRVLLFSQSKRMMNIIEVFLKDRKYSYLRMDGDTPVTSRQVMVRQYNKDPSIFVFLLSTKVGGLGINLTGANRIIIFDPDWNPVTDLQARERAWRIGQERQVTIYRLLTTGTIEEKIYHKQVFKSCLANRVLKDPKQPSILPSNDLADYFSIAAYSKTEGTLSSALFAGTGSEISMRKLMRRYNRFDAQQMNKDPKDVLKERQKAAKRRAGIREDSKASHHRADDVKQTKDDAKPTELILPSCRDLPTTVEARRELARQMSHKIEMEKRKREAAAAAIAASAGSSSDGQSSAEQKKSEAESGRRSSCENQPPNADSSRRSSSEHKHHRSEGESGTKSGHHASHHDRQESSGKRREGERKSSSEHRHSDSDRRGSAKHGHHPSEDRSSSKHQHSSLQRQGSKESREDRHQSKKKKDAKFEGQRIPFLAKTKSYTTADDGEDKQMNQEDYVLMKLLEGTHVQSIMHHEKIVNGKYSDGHLTKVEAEKVSKAAAAALIRSRSQCHSAMSGNPNNLGNGQPMIRFGQKSNKRIGEAEPPPPVSATPSKAEEAKKEPPKKLYERSEKKKEKRFGDALFDGSRAGFTSLVKQGPMTSNDIIVKLRKRQLLAGEEPLDLNQDLASAQRQIVDPEVMELLTDIRNFIALEAGVNGEATMKELWSHFYPLMAREYRGKFAALVKEICDVVRVNDRTVWRLKRDLR